MISYFLIFFASLFLNYGVQLSYYVWKMRKNPAAFAGERSLLDYYTGWLGDGVIVSLINILIFYVIDKIGYRLSVFELVSIFGVALVIDVITHYVQAKNKMTNWSMPKPFHWTFPGLWHMVSLPIQTSYLLLFFWIFVQNGMSILADSQLVLAATGVFSLMVLFLLLFRIDNPPLDTTI